MINTWKLIDSAPSASSSELFMYTIVTQVNGVPYVGWIIKEEEFEETNFVKILK